MKRAGTPLRMFLLPLVYYAVVTWVSHQPVWTSTPPPFPHFDKLFHCVEFLPLGILLCRAELTCGLALWRRAGLLSLVLGVLLGCADEFHQSFVEGRHADPLDAAADAVGIALGVLIWMRTTAGRSAIGRTSPD